MRGPPRCRGAGPRRAGASTSRSGIPRWWSTTGYGWEEHPLYPGGRVLRRVRHVPGGSRRARGPGDGCHRRAGLWRSRLGAGQPNPPAGRIPARLLRRPHAFGRRLRRRRARPKADPWYAEHVHHFAMSLNPDYRYEGGRFGDVAVHVLYQPGDEKTWGGGIAVERTQTALAWLDQLYGPFGWPQITNVHRIEGGGTEFPMMIMTARPIRVSSSTSSATTTPWASWPTTSGGRAGWTRDSPAFRPPGSGRRGPARATSETEAGMLAARSRRLRRAASLVSEAYRDFTSYNIAIYSRGELFFHQLRYIVGDETMHRILQTFYERWKLQARRRGRLPRGSRGGVGAGSLDLLRPVAAHDRAVRLRGRAGEVSRRASGGRDG